MEKFITTHQYDKLRSLHKKAREKRFADRIKTILLLNEGYNYAEISKILFLDDSTLRSYYETYINEGIDKLLSDNYQGGLSYLTVEQQEELADHIDETNYLSAVEIVEYVKKNYKLEYSVEGMRNLLHKMNFSYKKPQTIPGKLPDEEKQKAFINKYKRLKKNKNPEDNIWFMDGTHPRHNSIAAYGWIRKGYDKPLQSNTGRAKVNINGAYNTESGEVEIIEDEAVNAQSTIELLKKLSNRQKIGMIYIILDNAKYYKSQLVKEYLGQNARIKLIFLPPYSPNLNLIERLWKFLKKKMLYNQFYEEYGTFKKVCLNFFKDINKGRYREELGSLMNQKFQIIRI